MKISTVTHEVHSVHFGKTYEAWSHDVGTGETLAWSHGWTVNQAKEKCHNNAVREYHRRKLVLRLKAQNS